MFMFFFLYFISRFLLSSFKPSLPSFCVIPPWRFSTARLITLLEQRRLGFPLLVWIPSRHMESNSLGALAFAVGTTAGECSPQDFQQFILDKQIQLENSDELLLKRLIFESQTLFMTSIQNQVLSAGLPNSSDSNAKKLPPVERQTRITEQKKRLVGIIIQGGSGPSFELIDLAYTMIDSKSIKFIPQHRCTKRDTELLENTNKDKEILTIEQGRLTSKKSSLPNTSTSDALKLSNCFLRRALALDLAQVTSFIQINKYQHKKRSQLIPEFADIRWLPADYSNP